MKSCRAWRLNATKSDKFIVAFRRCVSHFIFSERFGSGMVSLRAASSMRLV